MMFAFLSQEVLAGLEAARGRSRGRRSRLCVHAGAEVFPVLRLWEGGFALDAVHGAHLRGLVDLYDGSRHMSHCLIMASVEENGELICEFKRSTAAHDQAPLDFERAEPRPLALLPKRF